MQGVLAGFVTLGAIIALGFLLAHLGVLRADSQLLLSRLVFFVATPALLFQTLATAPVDKILTSGLAVAALSFVGTAGVYVLLARTVWRRSTGDTVLGSLSSAYVNAANLGLPITVYVLGTASFIAPVLLMQLLVITPLAFAILDAVVSKRRPSLFGLLSQPPRAGCSTSTVARCWRQPWSRPCPQPRTSLCTPPATTVRRLWPVTRSSSRPLCQYPCC